jgi:ribosomal protein S18 acetylase RimI-like enzyme
MNSETRTPLPFTLYRLTASDASDYRALRLEGLRSHPEAFGASWEDEVSKPLGWFAERIERNAVFGASREGTALLGTAGLLVPDGAKSRHKGVLWGMFVRPEARGTGVAAALVARVIEQATDLVEAVRLTVVSSNMTAIRLYTRAGFNQYGLERRALKVEDQYYDELFMELPLNKLGAAHYPEQR